MANQQPLTQGRMAYSTWQMERQIFANFGQPYETVRARQKIVSPES
jgi:hypothetical protein